MASNRNLLVLPGDGIGPEVMNEVRKIIAWMGKKRAVGFDIEEDVVGGAALDEHGVPLTRRCHEDGARGRCRAVRRGRRPEVGQRRRSTRSPSAACLRLRKELDLFANLRPARCFDALVDASLAEARDRRGPRHHDRARAHRRRLFRRAARHRRPARTASSAAVDTQVYTTPEIERVARVAFELARKRAQQGAARSRRPTSCTPACCGARP